MLTTITGHAIEIDAAPSPSLMLYCWRAFEADPLRSMLLADTTAFVSAQHFLNAVGTSIVPFLACVDGKPAALAWLYDIAMLPPKMTPLSAFVAVYVLPAFRGEHLVRQCAEAFLDQVRKYGTAHLWAEVRCDNLPSQYALRACGFEKVATVPSWKRYAGAWQDMKLYHLPLAYIAETSP